MDYDMVSVIYVDNVHSVLYNFHTNHFFAITDHNASAAAGLQSGFLSYWFGFTLSCTWGFYFVGFASGKFTTSSEQFQFVALGTQVTILSY